MISPSCPLAAGQELELDGLDFEGMQVELQRIVSDSQARTRIFHQVSFVSEGDFGVQFDTLRTSLRASRSSLTSAATKSGRDCRVARHVR